MITLAVIGIALTTFSNAMSLNEATTQVADSNQNLRAGTNLLVRDLLAGGPQYSDRGHARFRPVPGAAAMHRPSPPATSRTPSTTPR